QAGWDVRVFGAMIDKVLKIGASARDTHTWIEKEHRGFRRSNHAVVFVAEMLAAQFLKAWLSIGHAKFAARHHQRSRSIPYEQKLPRVFARVKTGSFSKQVQPAIQIELSVQLFVERRLTDFVQADSRQQLCIWGNQWAESGIEKNTFLLAAAARAKNQ